MAPSARAAGLAGLAARTRIGRGPVAGILAMLGIQPGAFPGMALAPTLMTTTTVVGAAMALGLFGRRRRDDDLPDDDPVRRGRAPASRWRPTTRWATAQGVAVAPESGRPGDAHAALAAPVADPGAQGRPDPRRDAGPAADLRRGPRRLARRSRAAGHPLPRRAPARLARRAARRRDRLSRPGRRGPAAREVRRVLARGRTPTGSRAGSTR